MQHFPPDNCDAQPVRGTGEHRNAERGLDRRAARDSRPPYTASSSADEIDATIDWLAHTCPELVEGSPPAAFPGPERVEGKSADSRA